MIRTSPTVLAISDILYLSLKAMGSKLGAPALLDFSANCQTLLMGRYGLAYTLSPKMVRRVDPYVANSPMGFA